MSYIQERLFNPGEMAISMREFVRAKLEGFGLRQAARADKRRQQREMRNEDTAIETQACFGFEMTPEEHKAQMISFAYGNVKLHNPAITREDVERIYEQLLGNSKCAQ